MTNFNKNKIEANFLVFLYENALICYSDASNTFYAVISLFYAYYYNIFVIMCYIS